MEHAYSMTVIDCVWNIYVMNRLEMHFNRHA